MWECGGIFILHEEVDYMLTPKQNMLEVIKGGNPDRFVNQYEAVQLLFHPFMFANPLLQPGQENVVNAWGVTNTFPKGVPGSFPVHTPDKIVVKDIEDWKDYVHAPSLKFTQDQWDMVKAQYDAVDGEQAFKAAFVAPGLFEQTHHLCEISNALVYYITNPDEMHDLIKYLTEWALNSLRLFKELHLTGGVLRIDGEVVAFTIGEPICEDTYVVHIEKAYADVQGAYTMINQQFVNQAI